MGVGAFTALLLLAVILVGVIAFLTVATAVELAQEIKDVRRQVQNLPGAVQSCLRFLSILLKFVLLLLVLAAVMLLMLAVIWCYKP
jgi:amino acid transporter